MKVKTARPLDRVRTILFVALFYPMSLVMTLVLVPSLVFPRESIRPVCYLWVRLFMVMTRRVLGIRYRVKIDRAAADLIAKGPVIFAAKHQSMWETVAFNDLLNCPAFVLKKELMTAPVFGLFMKKFDMIPVDREAGASALKGMVRQSRQHLSEGRSIVIYPQGTRVGPGASIPYMPGVAALYNQTGVPVVPIALDSGRLWPRGLFVKRAGTITVTLLPPIEPGLDRERFMQELEQKIEQACG